MVEGGRIDLSGMLTHTFRLEQWREAFTALATQADSGAIKVAFDFLDKADPPVTHDAPSATATRHRGGSTQ